MSTVANKPGLLLSMIITFVYLWMVFMFGVMIAYLYSLIWPTDFTTLAGTAVAAVIFAFVAILDLGLLTLKKITPAVVLMVIAISPFLGIYRLMRNTDLLVVDKNTPDRIANYVFVKRLFAFG